MTADADTTAPIPAHALTIAGLHGPESGDHRFYNNLFVAPCDLAKLNNVLPEEQQQEVAWARRSLVATGLHPSPIEHAGHVARVLLHERRPFANFGIAVPALVASGGTGYPSRQRETDPRGAGALVVHGMGGARSPG